MSLHVTTFVCQWLCGCVCVLVFFGGGYSGFEDRPGFKSWLYDPLAMWPWASSLTFLSLSPVTCKTAIIRVSTHRHVEKIELIIHVMCLAKCLTRTQRALNKQDSLYFFFIRETTSLKFGRDLGAYMGYLHGKFGSFYIKRLNWVHSVQISDWGWCKQDPEILWVPVTFSSYLVASPNGSMSGGQAEMLERESLVIVAIPWCVCLERK